MRRASLSTFALVLLLAGCSEQAITSTESEGPNFSAEFRAGGPGPATPVFLLSPSNVCGMEDAACKHHGGDADGFAGPLFALATAPDGDILVADAGEGIATVDGSTEMVLPAVTGIAPVGRGTAWATAGARVEGGEDDTGQGLYRLAPGRTRKLVNLFDFEARENPDGDQVASNPFDVASVDGEWAYVTDAAANDLLRIDQDGNVEVVAVFPDELVSTANLQDLVGCPNPVIPGLAFICGVPMMPAEAVPTSVTIGPDGYLYVGELRGFPAPAGASNIWRVAPGASWAACGSSPDCEKVFDGGFTSIIDLAFGPDGRLYVAELDERSWFAAEVLHAGVGGTVNACDTASGTCEEVATGIPLLTAITFGKDGSLHATRNALIPPLAEVIEIQ